MLHRVLLTIHSGLRWVVLAMLLALLVAAIRGWRSGAALEKRDRILKGAAIGLADLQLLLGLTLYATGPWLTSLSEDARLVMRTSVLRFFVIEHATGMLAALVVLHVGSVLSKRAKDDPKAAWRRLAIATGVALLLILASIPWPFLPYARPLLRWG
ncbi:MAG: hypothetical protein KF729_08615 [Sandaracinaceae bacterium]|nr:hypothetical protein [Sandaracinaceae bacterium]